MRDLRDPLEAERLRTIAPDEFHTRRDFLKRTAVTAGLAASMGLVLDPDTLVAEAARRQREVALPSPRNLPIDTFVVLMMENRSFDHYLGWLPGADGRQAGLQFTDNQGRTFPTHRLQTDFQGCAYLDPDHSWAGGRAELDGGKMDGFLRADSDTFAIGYYTADDLPFTPHMTQAFTAFDRFFCSILSSTYPNREYMHAGQSYGKIDNSLPSGNGFPDTTIFAALSKAGVSNHYYYTDIPVSALWGSAGLSRSSQVQNFYEQAAAGTLPALSFVDPSFNGEDQGTSGDEHPHGDVRVGQAFVADVVHAFMASPQFKRGALFVIYDEWGGFFDHVVPPRVPDLRTSTNLMQDYGQMGFRIPAVMVSPYARRGHVDHSIYGFESILKMIRYRYGLPPLTPRDLYANNIAAAFDFASPNFTPPALPTPPAVISAACSGSSPVGTGGAGVDGGTLLGSPLPGGPPLPGDHVPPPVEPRPASVRRLAMLGLPVALAAGLLIPASLAAADSFNPVTMSIAVTPVARLAAPLTVTVGVKADPGVLDTGEGPLRVEVKLAPECGGDFQHTAGVTLINLALNPPPTAGKAYSGTMSDRGRPLAYGVQTVCAYLEDSTVGRVYASDQSLTVNVSPACTAAGRRYDSAARALARVRRQYRRAHGKKARRRAAKVVTHRRRTLVGDRRRGVAVCGPGVPL